MSATRPEILAGYDPRSSDRAPLAVGASLATLLDTPLVLTTVIDHERSLDLVDDEAFWDDRRADARRAVARTGATPDVDVRIVVSASAARGLATAIDQAGPAIAVL